VFRMCIKMMRSHTASHSHSNSNSKQQLEYKL
jgi:hypothetical protein